ncbi:hypothetical protein CKM354_000887900 [Cercospora kikuchii]|uniref:DUF4419 domain-containing protein n=1 Tax=Cercospora kikuchii TaxID=84275 RepID=A0A9P3CMV6_9PEZI|nr:uncharacterized protein CKM354_000887900 [Cercospora kikuchii]GIZ45724.1 hypothetical protein CKM354_000887900 [Cercospora kikuchii]
MPVTFLVAAHASKIWTGTQASTAGDLFKASCQQESEQSKGILRSSFSHDLLSTNYISPSKYGLVYAAYHAYSGHHHLRLRPEDVWFAILAQISFYINAHAEKLRHLFVAHDGREELIVEQVGTLGSADIGGLAVKMTDEMQKNILDSELRIWIMPSFTTTTEEDRVVASVWIMGTLQKYFSYSMGLICGIPTVTLLGEKEDWEAIEQRLDKLQILGKEPNQFADILRPILKYFLMSFEEPASPAVKDFWGKIAHHQSGHSGPTYLSGWITAFCFWDEKGQSLVRLPDEKGCELNDVLYHRVDTKQIPSGYVSVPAKLNANGKVHHTKILAGSVGIQASHSPSHSSTGMPSPEWSGNSTGNAFRLATAGSTKLDTLQPVSEWWMFEVDPNAPDLETQHKLREQKQLEDMGKQFEEKMKRCDQGVK